MIVAGDIRLHLGLANIYHSFMIFFFLLLRSEGVQSYRGQSFFSLSMYFFN